MKSYRLNLNASKTQFMRCATSRRRGHLSTAPIEFCGEKIHPETSAMTFKPHISSVVSSCF